MTEVTYPIPDTHPKPVAPPSDPKPKSERNVKEPCPECDKPIAVGYMRTHLREIHGITLPPGRRGRKPGGMGIINAPLSDDAVSVVLDVIFPSGIPVRHLEAVVKWRDATIAFLKEVQT